MSVETYLVLFMSSVVGVPALVIGLVSLRNWRRSEDAKRRGRDAIADGRVFDAIAEFAVCSDRLLLTGEAKLWLWRLSESEHDLRYALSLEGHRYDDIANPLLLLIGALRNRRQVLDALRHAAATDAHFLPAVRLALAVTRLREADWARALAVLSAKRELAVLGLRANALIAVFEAWAQSGLDGTVREIDVASVLGEGSIDELKEAWPELGRVLESGRTGA